MPEYRLSLDFTAADDQQAERLALAWSDTCTAEYGTRMAGFERIGVPVFKDGHFLGHHPRTCGEHRTVGAHRAWCFDCGEWCYPKAPCARCESTSGSYERPTKGPAGGV